jgi:pimeloyl-ACP methyl ester carboxylesterase
MAIMEKTTGSVTLRDGKIAAYTRLCSGYESVVILVHGFFNNKDAYLFEKIAEMFAKKRDVISYDLRGHGKSTGLFTWMAKEPDDLGEIVSLAKACGYRRVAAAGFSVGAGIAIIEGSRNKDIDAVIAVSPPYAFWQIDAHFWEPEMFADLLLNLGPKGKGKGVRPGNIFSKKISPRAVIHHISPKPLLLIHGEKDWLIKPHHSQKLHDAAGEPKETVIVKNGGHAEKMFNDDAEGFEKICVGWLDRAEGLV